MCPAKEGWQQLGWEALARKNSREMVQKLIEEAGRSRGDKGNPSKSPGVCVCVVSE